MKVNACRASDPGRGENGTEVRGEKRGRKEGEKRCDTYSYVIGPGVSPSMMAAAAIAPVICAMQYRTKRVGPMQPQRRSARLTSGLKSPPVARKKNQAETSKLSPNAVAI